MAELNSVNAQTTNIDLLENIIRKDVQAQNDRDIETYLSLRLKGSNTPEDQEIYLKLKNNTDFVFNRIKSAKLIDLVELPEEIGAKIISYKYFQDFSDVKIFFATIEYSLLFEDKYLHNGSSYRLYVLGKNNDNYSIIQLSEAPLYELQSLNFDGVKKIKLNKVNYDYDLEPPSRIKVLTDKGIDNIDFDTYIKDVLPNEWLSGWNIEALKAGILCIKMYGWWYTKYPVGLMLGYDIGSTTDFQNYRKDSHNDIAYGRESRNAAFAAVRNIGFVAQDNSLFFSEYWNGLAIEFNTNNGIKIYSKPTENSEIKKTLTPGTYLECLSNGYNYQQGKHWWLVREYQGGANVGYAKGEEMKMFPVSKVKNGSITGINGTANLINRLTQYGTQYHAELGKNYEEILHYFYDNIIDSHNKAVNTIKFFTYQPNITSIKNISLSNDKLFSGMTFSINYEVESNKIRNTILGASLSPSGQNKWIYSDPTNDKRITLINGISNYSRIFNLSNTIPAGSYDLMVALWSDENNNGIVDPQSDLLLDSQIINKVLQIDEQQPTVQITIYSVPSGLSFNVDNGSSYQTPHTFTWVKNSSHNISWSSLQNGPSGTRYSLNKWSDNNTSNPRIINALSSTSYTINYDTQYFLTMNTNGSGIIIPGSGWYNKGESVSIKAVPSNGFTFTLWNGSGSGSYTGNQSYSSVSMNGPITQTAIFSNSVGTITVTNPTQSSSWISGSQVVVNWSATNNISSVNIKLSTNGGSSFPIILASDVTASSSLNLVVPNYISNLCQIKVESKTDANIFGTSGIFSIQPQIITNPPSVATLAASNIGNTSAQFNATINPNGLSTTYYFDYGISTSYGSKSTVKNAGSGSSALIVNETISNLSSSTKYYYRIVAQNSNGTTYGSQSSFNTLQLALNQKPLVFTRNATNYNYNSATLNGSINPNGKSTTYYFVYGKTTGYGNQTTVKNVGSASDYLDVNEQITGLETSTTYHFKIIASNSDGTTEGNDFTFTTESIQTSQIPIVQTSSSGNITLTTAQVKGIVNPNGYNTTYYFDYGTTTAYGSKSLEQMTGIGTSNINVAADLSGLSAETTYNFRLVAKNAAGTSYGQNMTFKTASKTSVPIIVYEEPTSITNNQAQLNTLVNPNGFPTSVYFEWGLTTSYGNSTNAVAIGYGISEVHVQRYINGTLSPGTIYHYRVVATNSIGTTYSPDYTFKTLSGPLRPPTVVTMHPTNITDNSAQFNGTVNPNEVKCTYTFIYGYSPGGTGKQGTVINLSAGTQPVNVTQKITGLEPNTSYTFFLYAWSEGGNSWGEKISFKTLTANVPPPEVITLDASDIRVNDAYLNAAINPNGSATLYHFEYGLTQNYGQRTQDEMTGNQIIPINVKSIVQDLSPNTTYHYRVLASNAGGSTVGQDKTFSTFLTINNPPSVSTYSATNIASNSAQLHGKINPNSRTTTYYFEYGPNLNYGNRTTTKNIGAGSTLLDVNETITNLVPNTKYYYRLIGENSGGLSDGGTFNFQTQNELFSVSLTVNTPQGGAAIGNGTFQKGQAVNILATPNTNYLFNNWTENGIELSKNNSYDFYLDKNRNISANFKALSKPILSVQPLSINVGFNSGQTNIAISNIGTGDMNWSATTTNDWLVLTKASGINDGTLIINYNENNGAQREGKIIVSAEGSADSPKEILIKQDSLKTYKVITNSNPNNAGITIGTGTFKSNAQVSVTAIPNENYIFKNWQENGSTLSINSSYQFPLRRDISLTANFEFVPKSIFVVNTSVSPPEGGTVSGSGTYSKGNNVVLSAVPNNGWEFIAWIEGRNLVTTEQKFNFNIENDRYLIALFQLLTNVKENELITDYLLHQNYPNPFNPKTKIRFDLPKTSNVILKIYDILGREVATLVNKEMLPGSYEVKFTAKGEDGRNLPSGIYFYRLQAGNFSQTKKLLLLK